jgi:excisionase family DNA binding protein
MTSQTRPIEPLAYSIPDSCKAAGVGRSTIYNEIKAGALQISKIGDRTLIEVDELKRWLASKRQRAA